MLGEFLGLTGTSAALLDTNLSRYSSMLNNPLDSFRISNFRTELQYLINFLDTKVQLQYSSPELRRLMRRSDLIRNNSVVAVKRAYGIDIEGMSELERESLAKKLDEEVEEMARKDNSPKSIVNSFVVVDTGERISLGDEELMILEKFKTYYYRVLKTYERMCSTESFKEIIIFGDKLHNIAVRSPLYLLSLVSAPSVNREEWITKCLNWVEIIRSHFESSIDLSSRGSETSEEYIRSSVNFPNYILSVNGLDPATSSTSDLPEQTQNLLDLFELQSEDFIQTLVQLSGVKGWRPSYVNSLVELYYRVFRLDHDMSFVSEALFPEGSGIVMTRKELEPIYRRLNSIGFYFFHFTNTNLFMDSLKKVTFSSEKTVIDPDKEHHGFTFRRVLEDIENYCYSIMPMGTELEEVSR